MKVVDLTDEHMAFVASCTHVDALSEETREVVKERESWLRETLPKGLKVKVALDEGQPVGFAHCLPIELGALGMSGKDLMTVPCLTLKYDRVYREERGSGYGRALMEAVEAEARKEKKGVAVLAYEHDIWFMPASFFAGLGYREVERHGDTVIMMKAFEPVEPPAMHRLNYQPKLAPGKVVVDAFWHPLCSTSITEIHRVREICAEFGDKVVLNEFNCGDRHVLEKYQTWRALFFNGVFKCWGYEAPHEGIRKIIRQELEKIR